MNNYRGLLFAVLVAGLLVACGGGGDDDDDAAGNSDSTDGGSDSGSDSDSDDNGSGNEGDDDNDVSIADLEDGTFSTGQMRIEVSGDEGGEYDLTGTGTVQDGGAFFTFFGDAGVSLAFTPEDEENTGGFTFQTTELATAGAWGEGCDVELKSEGGKLSGEFNCEDITAIEPGTTNDQEVTIRATFTAEP